MKCVHFFGPKDKWQGRFGLTGSILGANFTLHFLPRTGFKSWGYRKEDWFYSLDLGPVASLCVDTEKTVMESKAKAFKEGFYQGMDYACHATNSGRCCEDIHRHLRDPPKTCFHDEEWKEGWDKGYDIYGTSSDFCPENDNPYRMKDA